jgi:hypothetical protein
MRTRRRFSAEFKAKKMKRPSAPWSRPGWPPSGAETSKGTPKPFSRLRDVRCAAALSIQRTGNLQDNMGPVLFLGKRSGPLRTYRNERYRRRQRRLRRRDHALRRISTKRGASRPGLPANKEAPTGAGGLVELVGNFGRVDAHFVTMSTKELVDEVCFRRLFGITSLTRDEMRLAGYADDTPAIDVCAGIGQAPSP